MSDEPERLNDKYLWFKECDGCGKGGVTLHRINGRALCSECSKHE